jgi:hypothetical protein
MLNYYDLGSLQVGLKSFVISLDYRVYIRQSMCVNVLAGTFVLNLV